METIFKVVGMITWKKDSENEKISINEENFCFSDSKFVWFLNVIKTKITSTIKQLENTEKRIEKKLQNEWNDKKNYKNQIINVLNENEKTWWNNAKKISDIVVEQIKIFINILDKIFQTNIKNNRQYVNTNDLFEKNIELDYKNFKKLLEKLNEKIEKYINFLKKE